MYGYIDGSSSNNFEIRTVESPKLLEQGETVVITRKDSTITLGCTEEEPCRLTIKGEE
jgi:hypothetical protein